MKMGKEILRFSDSKIEKNNYRHENFIFKRCIYLDSITI